MADEQSRKVVIPVVAENQTKSTFQDIKSDAADMAASVEQAGNRAAKGVGGIGDGMDAAAQKFNRGEAAIASALQRYIEKTAIAARSGESLSNAFSQKIELRGLDAGKFDPLIQKAREAESALAAVRAQQSQSAGRNAFLDSLTAQTAAIGKSKSELLELQAAQMGVAAQAAPLIARMREAEAGVGKVGMSAAATAAAMRNVPAQFTDIVVSLQAGQAPLTVLLQQGGQLKDMFGGAGAAAKAIGTYMLGLVNPLTVAAAAVGVLAYAYYQGSQETDNFRKSLLLSGNQAATSVEQLNSMARAMASTVGSQGRAAAGLAEMAQNSKVGAESLREFTTAAIQWEKATGDAVSETAKRFADLAKDPLKASLALNEQMNFLTASVYSQIKALDEQGKKEEAAAVAQKAYSDALKSRSNEAVQNIGWVERAYKAAGNAATWAWDRIAGIGRPETQQSAAEIQMAELEKRIADRQKRAQEDGDSGGAWAKGTEKLKLQLAAMKELNGQLSSVDAFIANMATANKDYIDSTQALDDIAGQFAKKDVKRKQELTAAQNAYNTAVEKTKKLYADSPELQGKLDAQKAKYDQAVAGINDRFKDPKGRTSGGVKISDNQVAGLEAQLVAAKQYAEQLRLVGAAASEANVGERESLKLSELMEKATDGKTRAKLAEAKAIADALGVQLRSNDGLEKSLKAHQALIDGNYKDADAISQRAKAQQAANAVYGQGRTEIERMTLATMDHQLAEAEGSDSFDPKYIASLREKIKAQREWVGALDAFDYKKLDDQLTKSLEASKQELSIQQQGLSLLGMEESQRKAIVVQRKIELDVAKKIAEVEKQYKGRSDIEALKEAEALKRKIQEQGAIDTQIAIGQIQEEYALKNAEKYNDIFRQGFADYVNNGTQGLKAFGKSLKTTVLTSISDALYQAFAQKYVVNLVGSVTGMFGGGAAAAGANGAAAAAGGASGLLNGGLTNWSNLGTMGADWLWNSGMSLINNGFTTVGGALMDFSGTIANVDGMFQGLGLSGGLGSAMGYLGSIFALTQGNYGAAIGSAIGTFIMPGIGTMVGSVLGNLVGGLFGRKLKESGVEGDFGGESGFEGRLFKYYKGGLFRSNKTTYEELPEEMRSVLGNQFLAMDESIRDMAGAVGLGGEALDGFTARIKVNLKGLSEEEATKKLQEEFQKIADQMGGLVLTSEEYTRAGETQLEALTRLSTSITLANEWFKAVGGALYDVGLAGADMASELMDAFGGADKFAASTGNFYDKFYTDQEKVANQTRLLNEALNKLGVESMPASREALRDYLAGIDKSTEEGQKLYASLIGLADVFDLIYASAENIASLKEDLNVQLLRAQGNDDEATKLERARQLKDLEKYKDPELVRMQVEVWAAEDKTKSEEAAKKAADELAEQLAAALKAAQDLAMKNLDAAVSREKEYWNQFSNTAQEKLSQAASYFDLFTGTAKSLRGSMDDAAAYQAAAGMVYIEQALENARKGLAIGDYDQTKTAVDAASSGLVMDNYATQAELDYDKKVLAGQLDELGGYAALAKTDAQKQIDLATAQIKRLDDTLTFWKEYGETQVNATLSVADAIKALEKLMFPEKDAAEGGGSGASSGRGGASFGGGGGSIISGGGSESMFEGYLPDGRPVYKDGSIGTAMGNTASQLANGKDPYSNYPDYSGSGKVVYDEEKGLYVPKLNVGTNYLPSDMLVLAHQGERIIPKADNHALMAALSNQGGSAVQMAEVVAELRAVKQELQAIKAGQGEVAYQARKTASVLSSVTDGGLGMRNQPATA